MGNGNIKLEKPRLRILPREPEHEKYNIPEEEPDYPKALSPKIPTKDIYDPKYNKKIYLHARRTPREKEDSWKDLVDYLTSKYKTDMEKVRSIFSWLGIQYIESGKYMLVSTTDSLEDTTPKGFKKTIKQGEASYAAFFALLCRKAGIQCAIIQGISKGFGYDVGVSEVSNLKDKWNAVYIDGWRLIHPLWAFKTVISYKNGKWVPDTVAKRLKVKAKNVDKTLYQDFNEYFFLVEPSELIHLCLPDKQKWQMCTPVMKKELWVKSPYLMKRFHMEGFNIYKEFRTTLQSKNGYCSLLIQAPKIKDGEVDYQLAYDVYFNFTKGKADTEDVIYLDKYAILARDSNKKKWILEARLPLAGLYRITVYGGLSTESSLPWICDLAIECKKPAKNVKPYPDCPDIGFGPVDMTTHAGLSEPSFSNGILFLKSLETYHITFKTQRTFQVKVKLISDVVEESETSKWTNVTFKDMGKFSIMDIAVKLEIEGEYALEIFVNTKMKAHADEGWENVCNYYLSTDSVRRHGLAVKTYKVHNCCEIHHGAHKEEWQSF